VSKPGKHPNFPSKLRPISFLSTMGKLRVFKKLILRTIQKHIEEGNLVYSSLFGFEQIKARNFNA
jgi:hypothetical protein